MSEDTVKATDRNTERAFRSVCNYMIPQIGDICKPDLLALGKGVGLGEDYLKVHFPSLFTEGDSGMSGEGDEPVEENEDQKDEELETEFQEEENNQN